MREQSLELNQLGASAPHLLRIGTYAVSTLRMCVMRFSTYTSSEYVGICVLCAVCHNTAINEHEMEGKTNKTFFYSILFFLMLTFPL